MRNLLTCLAVVCILAGCKREFADLSTGTIAATPINPQPGATVSISMRVTNFGESGAGPSTWSVNRDGIQGFTGGNLPGLSSGESTTIVFPVTEVAEASHVYQVIVNANNAVEEANYADNSASIRVTWALPIDLQAGPLGSTTTAPSAGLPVTLSTTVTNAVTAAGTATGVSWSVTRDGVVKFVTGVVPTLAPGASIAVPVTLPVENAGPHTYDFIIDPDGTSTDSDRTNNTQSITVVVAPISG